MGCVLHITGDTLDVERLVGLCPVEPAVIFHKGQPRSSRPNAGLCRTSGIAVAVSDADFDKFEDQKAEAEAFLRVHQSKLSEMLMLPGIQHASLDFGIEMRNVIYQTDSFDASLIALMAPLNLSLVLSQYPTAKRDKRIKQYRRALRNAT